MKLNRILVPLDGSALAESALGPAVELARPSGATVLLVRTAEATVFPGTDLVEDQVHVVREAEGYLAGVADRLRREGLHAEPSVWYGPAAAGIVEAARRRSADLIVMSTHGRSGLGRLILGSVAESVLRGTATPILLLRAPEAPLAAVPGRGTAGPAREPS
ncbi:MAG TPA: universal stress protein [Verrucomicrobiae bacterium]|jgi:nucleotide-binding universal stress UspA family protein|nr:universal stress protein [Verrucomicrobiae bacterium]